jgi:hypothetical protein
MNLKQFLLKRGPYQFEVQFKNSTARVEAEYWLKANADREQWELLRDHINNKGKKTDYVFLNDKSAALYIKLTWG